MNISYRLRIHCFRATDLVFSQAFVLVPRFPSLLFKNIVPESSESMEHSESRFSDDSLYEYK